MNHRGHAGRFAQNLGGEHHVEAGPRPGCAGFFHGQLDELGRLRLQQVGRLQQQLAAFIGSGFRPGRKRSGGGGTGSVDVGDLAGRRCAGDAAGERVETVECLVVDRGHVGAVDQKRYVHFILPKISSTLQLSSRRRTAAQSLMSGLKDAVLEHRAPRSASPRAQRVALRRWPLRLLPGVPAFGQRLRRRRRR